jgi:hypothetical protein
MDKKNIHQPIFYLIHPDDMLESYIKNLENIIDNNERFERYKQELIKSSPNGLFAKLFEPKEKYLNLWLDYSQIAKNNGLFVVVFKDQNNVSNGVYKEFYKTLQTSEGQSNVISIYDGFNSDQSSLARLLENLEVEMNGLNARNHFFAGGLTHDCVKLAAEMLAYGVGTGIKYCGLAIHSNIKETVSVDKIHIIKEYTTPESEKVVIVDGNKEIKPGDQKSTALETTPLIKINDYLITPT